MSKGESTANWGMVLEAPEEASQGIASNNADYACYKCETRVPMLVLTCIISTAFAPLAHHTKESHGDSASKKECFNLHNTAALQMQGIACTAPVEARKVT